MSRTYGPIDSPSDVMRGSDGTWRIRGGSRIRVTLSMATQSHRHHVALVDPLPAGLEAIQPDSSGAGGLRPAGGGATRSATEQQLLTTGGQAPGTCCRWGMRWWSHEAFRADRVAVFSELVPSGVYSYSYVARATTLGMFTAPPSRVEEMYHPSTFGRSATERVVVH